MGQIVSTFVGTGGDNDGANKWVNVDWNSLSIKPTEIQLYGDFAVSMDYGMWNEW